MPADSAVTGAIERVGPVIVVTTAVLVMGIGTTIVSDLPPSRVFGLLCVGMLMTALAADLLSLPASILTLGRDFFCAAAEIAKKKPAPETPAPAL